MENAEPPKVFLVVVAGPNGSGKTTITDKLRSQSYDLGEYINADEITQDLLKESPSPSLQETFQANRKAQTIADERRQAVLDEGRSMSFEMVMSHPSKGFPVGSG
jgi:predicted ABC-type ATPase